MGIFKREIDRYESNGESKSRVYRQEQMETCCDSSLRELQV